MSKTIFVYLNHAYISELALTKHEGVTVEETSLFDYGGELPVILWRVEGGPEQILITADANEALAEYKAASEDCYLHDVAVLDSNSEKAPCGVILSQDVPEYALEHLRA